MKTPSEKQIELAEKIAHALNLDFPRGDFDFTAQVYWKFINKHIQEYRESQWVLPLWVDDDDIFYGYEEGLWEY